MDLIQMSVQGGILIIAVVLIRSVFLNKLPKRVLSVLWAGAVIRLLLPFTFYSQISVHSVIEAPVSGGMTAVQAASGSATVSEALVSRNAVWIAGIIAASLLFLIIYLKSHRDLRFAIPVDNSAYIDDWLRSHRSLRHIRVMQSDRINTPIAAGIVRPMIILPKALDLSDEKLLEKILIHEYRHIRSLDGLRKILLAFTACIHWFNPLVWVMLILANRDMEISCDEWVLRHLGDSDQADYAYSLIEMAGRKSSWAVYSGFSKNSLEERITAIMKFKKTSRLCGVVAVTFLVMTFLMFASTGTFASAGGANEIDVGFDDAEYAERLKDYEELGLKYVDVLDGTQLQYDGEAVSFFIDNHSGTGKKFCGTVYDENSRTGKIYLEAKRDSEGNLVAINKITPKRASKLAFWR